MLTIYVIYMDEVIYESVTAVELLDIIYLICNYI